MTTPLRRNTPLQRDPCLPDRLGRTAESVSRFLERNQRHGVGLRWPRATPPAVRVLGSWWSLVTVVASLLFALLRLPSPVLFGSLVGGMAARADRHRTELDMPPLAFRLGQALVGAVIGALVQLPTLAAARLRLAVGAAGHRRHAGDQPGRRTAAGPAPRRLPRPPARSR